MDALSAVLKARFGTKVSGHWVAMMIIIITVKLMNIAYAWSQRGVSYFLPAYGSNEQSTVLYQSNFEDEFGNVDFNLIPRPHIAHFLYLYLHLIDEHNTQRHSILNLEWKWQIKCCWFRLLNMLAGQSVVNFHRLYRSEKKTRIRALCGQLMDDDATIIKFRDLLYGNLVQRQCIAIRPSNRQAQTGEETLLARICIDDKTH
jgi:hypothetical protein